MDTLNWNGLKISRLTLGTVQLGMDYGVSNKIGKPDAKEAFDILDYAKNGGITALDTSSDYGDSENVIGKYIRSKDSSPFTIVTKFSVDADSADELAVEKCIRKSVETSIERLGIESLDVLLSHNEEDILRHGDILPAILRRLKNEGLIRHAGASINTEAAIEQIVNNDVYEAVQLPFNMFDTARLNDGSIESLKNADKLVFIRSVFLQGLFFMQADNLPQGVLQYAKEPLLKLRELSQREGMSIAQMAVDFVITTPGVSSLVLGVASSEQVDENLKLFDKPRISEQTRHDIIKLYKSIKPEVMMPWKWKK